MGEHKWVRSSLRRLSAKLKEQGHAACYCTVRRLLRQMGFSLRANKRRQVGIHCPDRDEQFHYIAQQRAFCCASSVPIISVDTKKKELIGEFRNHGRVWCRKATEVDEHDFPSLAECLAVPFGIYDVMRNKGYVVVGTSYNTPEFAVNSIVKWWKAEGARAYPRANELLILADCGGGNGSKSRAWKWNLQTALCDRFNLTVTVCHYPTGCSKWNPVEHRLFSQISINWAGKPLKSLGIMLGYIRGTTTITGLTVKAELDDSIYRKGQKVTWEEIEELNLKPHAERPHWNYTLIPRKTARTGYQRRAP